MIDIKAEQIFVNRKEYIRAINRRMNILKWLLLIGLVAVPIVFLSGETMNGLAMIGGLVLIFMINLGNAFTNRFTFSRKSAQSLFDARIYKISEDDLTIEYADGQSVCFSRDEGVGVKKKRKFFTIADKNRFELIPKAVFQSEEQIQEFSTVYMKKK